VESCGRSPIGAFLSVTRSWSPTWFRLFCGWCVWVFNVYEAYDVDENGTSILKQPTVSSFWPRPIKLYPDLAKLWRNLQWRDEGFKHCLIKPPLRCEYKGRALKHLLLERMARAVIFLVPESMETYARGCWLTCSVLLKVEKQPCVRAIFSLFSWSRHLSFTKWMKILRLNLRRKPWDSLFPR
jgi:hypothetical protein